MKKALITGITGQDGSYLAEFLLEKGYEVHGIVRRASISNTARIDHLIEKNAITLHDGDLSDSSGLIRLVGEIKPDEIYNLAAQSHVQVSFDAPEYSGDVDALGVLRVLEAVRVCGLTKTCKVYVVNELDVPILCMGLKDVVVSASPEGILVSDKEQSSYIKPYVNTLDHRVMFAEKSWGSFKVIDIDKASMTIKVTLNAGHQMNYHSHQHRDEVWTVIAGKGKTIVDGMEQNVKAGDVITMSAGCRHTVIAETELKLIEVQLGEAIDVHDKQKFELEY